MLDIRTGEEQLSIKCTNQNDLFRCFEGLNHQKMFSFQQMIKNSLKLSTSFSVNLFDLFVGTQNGSLLRYDYRFPEHSVEIHQLSNDEITCVKVDPTGGCLALGTSSGELILFDI